MPLTRTEKIVLAAAIIVDILDYFVLSVPILGDIADAVIVYLFTRYFPGKHGALANLIYVWEMIAGLDFLPLGMIAAVYLVWAKKKEIAEAPPAAFELLQHMH